MDLQSIRRDYNIGHLTEADVPNTPFTLFESWLSNAVECGLNSDPTAMTVATVDSQGQPSQRIVLLKGFDESGLRFFTNKVPLVGQDAHSHDMLVLLEYLAKLIDPEFQSIAKTLAEETNGKWKAAPPKTCVRMAAKLNHDHKDEHEPKPCANIDMSR